MPFTPFHFGVGIAAKALLSRHFQLVLFVILQIVIDLESLYNLVNHRRPVHRFLHTVAGATLLAVLSSLLLLGFAFWRRRFRPDARSMPWLFASLLATALFATWSHVALDAVMHQDVRPFWPLMDSNPLLHVVRVGTLHGGCLLLGAFGLAALGFQWALPAYRPISRAATSRQC